jgi:pyruvate dehydrogenase E2 component (dihydrolipoamide acetyltransferase)
MAEIIRMPKMSDTMTEGVIASWLKKVGDKVKSGDVLAEVETDKATMELEAYQDGVLLHIGVEAKSSVPVDGMIAIIGKSGEDISTLLKSGNSAAANTAPSPIANLAAPESAQKSSIDLSAIKATVIRMPKMSDTMTEGGIVAWHKKVGDQVKSGDLLAEVETDKATMELESYDKGTLLHIGVAAGKVAKVDDIIAIIGEPGTDISPLLVSGPASSQASAPVTSASTTNAVTSSTPSVSKANGSERMKISPLARKMAMDRGISLQSLIGSGENGRIIKRDIEEFKADSTQPAPAAKSTASFTHSIPAAKEGYTDLPVSQMRKTIARRLGESMFTAPHFYLTMEIDMDKAVEARKSINELSPVKISFNDLVIKAAALALRQHPKVNSAWMGDKIRQYQHIHVGMAVAVEEGLLVPVIRHADQKNLSTIAQEAKDFGAKAKNKQLQPSDWEGNTFTISNLGMFGIEEFTAIINPPDSCILAVGGIKQTPVVKNNQIVPGQVMKVTLSCDHRSVDGAVGSAFLQTFKSLLEDPIRMLI